MTIATMTTEDLCGCCDRCPCVHDDEQSTEEIDAEVERRAAELDAAWARWPQRGRL